MGTNIKTNVTNPTEPFLEIGANYKEQVQRRDATTGKLLAASAYFNPIIVEFQRWPGYGGLIYYGAKYQNSRTLLHAEFEPRRIYVNRLPSGKHYSLVI